MMAQGQLQNAIGYLRQLVRSPGSEGIADAELLRRFVMTRDEAAFELLMWRHGGMVLGLCQRVLQEPHEAEDAFQATFLALVRKAGSIGRHGSVGSWLFKVAYRVALDAKGQARRRAARSEALADLPDPAPSAQPSARAAERELSCCLDEEISRLPEKLRIPFVLCHLEGKTNEEGAREMGCPLGTVLSRLSRARERLRDRLTRRGVTLAGAALLTVVETAAAAAPLSTALSKATVSAALAYAQGKVAVAGLVSPQVLTLAEGAIKTMLLMKLRLVLIGVLVLSAGLFGGVVAWQALAAQAQAPDPIAPVPVAQAVENNVKGWSLRLGATFSQGKHFEGEPVLLSFAEGKLALSTSTAGQVVEHEIVLLDVATGKKLAALVNDSPAEFLSTAGAGQIVVAFGPGVIQAGVAAGKEETHVVTAGSFKLSRKLLSVHRLKVDREPLHADALLLQGNLLAVLGSIPEVVVVPGDPTAKGAGFSGLVPATGMVDITTDKVLAARELPKGNHSLLRVSRDKDQHKVLLFSHPQGEDAAVLNEFDLATGKSRTLLDNLAAGQLAVSPDGQFLAYVTAGGKIQLHDLARNQALAVLDAPASAINCLVFSPDGNVLATAESDGMVKLWDVATRQPKATLPRQGPLRGLLFSADGTCLAGASYDDVKLWTISR